MNKIKKLIKDKIEKESEDYKVLLSSTQLEKLATCELERCKVSPYYFATHYLRIKDKDKYFKFTTNLSEKDFNDYFSNLTAR
jgi:hypothetical protein